MLQEKAPPSKSYLPEMVVFQKLLGQFVYWQLSKGNVPPKTNPLN